MSVGAPNDTRRAGRREDETIEAALVRVFGDAFIDARAAGLGYNMRQREARDQDAQQARCDGARAPSSHLIRDARAEVRRFLIPLLEADRLAPVLDTRLPADADQIRELRYQLARIRQAMVQICKPDAGRRSLYEALPLCVTDWPLPVSGEVAFCVESMVEQIDSWITSLDGWAEVRKTGVLNSTGSKGPGRPTKYGLETALLKMVGAAVVARCSGEEAREGEDCSLEVGVGAGSDDLAGLRTQHPHWFLDEFRDWPASGSEILHDFLISVFKHAGIPHPPAIVRRIVGELLSGT